jgi:predicted TIM-barrel fold metal-dependent hydrolase
LSDTGLSRRRALQLGGLAAVAAAAPAVPAATASAATTSAGSSSRGRIDTHFHFLTPGVQAWAEQVGVIDPANPPTWAVSDPDHAFAVMEANGIAAGVASYPVPSMVFRSPELARSGVKLLNEEAAGLVRRYPKRFGFFATVALEHPTLAIDQAKYALDELGADGVILMTNARGNYLGHPDFDPLLAELNRRKTVVLTHPQGLPGGGTGGLPGLDSSVIEFLYETTQMALNLVVTGALDRYPDLSIILSHGGGFLPYAANRIISAGGEGWGPGPDAIRRALRRFYYDTALPTSPNSISTLAAVADPTRILFGSDWPARTDEQVRTVTRALDHDPAIDGRLRRRINRQNALDLLPSLRARL